MLEEEALHGLTPVASSARAQRTGHLAHERAGSMSTLVYSADQVAELRARERLLLLDIDREGVRI